MGTTLSGTTPQSTYPALIKVGDNSALSATLKTLSDGAGNDLPMQVSTSIVNFTGNVGFGAPTPTEALTISGNINFLGSNRTIASSSTPLNAIYSDSLLTCRFIRDSGGQGILFTDTGGSAYAKMGVGNLNTTIGQSSTGVVPDLGARLGIRGSGSTSATTALLVQNSNGNKLFEILDSQIANAFMYSFPMTNNGGLTLKSNVGTTETPALFLRPNTGLNGANIYVLDNKIYFRLINTNQVGSDSVYVFATDNRKAKLGVTPDDSIYDSSIYAKSIWDGGSAGHFRSFSATQTANVLEVANYDNSQNYINVSANGNLRIGNGAVDTARTSIKGSGSTSATTSLLVQNSGGTDLVRVQDNGVLTLGTFATGLGKIVVACDPTYGTKTILENNFGGQIIRQQSTDVIIFGGQAIMSLTAIGYMGLSAPYIVGNYPIGNTTGSSFDFRVTGSPYAQTPSTPSRGVLFDGGFNFQSGGYANYFELSPTYSFDISNNRIVKGIYYNPTLVTPNTNDKHYGIQTTSGGAYINTATPNDSAALQADSTTQGFLPPRMTTAQKLAIYSPAVGLMVFDTDLGRPCFYNGAWVTL